MILLNVPHNDNPQLINIDKIITIKTNYAPEGGSIIWMEDGVIVHTSAKMDMLINRISDILSMSGGPMDAGNL